MKIIRHHRENGLQLMLFHIRKEDSSNHYQALVDYIPGLPCGIPDIP